MKKLLLSLLFFCSVTQAQIVTVPIPGAPGLNVTVGTGVNALPLQNIYNNPSAVNITTGDDSYSNVPLQFQFPFFGRTFSNSWAMTNGMVTFQDPSVSGIYGACCSGINLSNTSDTRWNYSIFGLHTDLYSWNGSNQYYLSEPTQMTYGWYNISQCCGSGGGNSFEIKINSAGLVDTRIAGALINYNAVTSGMSGDLSKGEYYQHYHGQGINITPGSASIFTWQALSGTGSDICISNPLSSPSCPGYASAYFNQQCTISALYDPTCPGYAAAYFTQQCNANPLYNSACPGYQQAYFNQQCELDGLYSTTCPNYAQAYAKKNILGINSSGSTSSTSTTNTTQSTPSTTISSDGSVSTTVSRTGDSNVDKAISSPTTSTTAAAAPAAPVQLAPTGGSNAVTQTNTQAQQQQKTETKTASPSDQRTEQRTAKTEQKSDDKQKSSEMKQAATQKAKEEMKKAETASTFEGQVAVQASVIGAMSFVPGFNAYAQANVPDILGAQLQRQYGKEVIDNRRAIRLLGGGQYRLHQEMVNGQYR
jgi:hypothetical protein